jgi:hypothetical protein
MYFEWGRTSLVGACTGCDGYDLPLGCLSWAWKRRTAVSGGGWNDQWQRSFCQLRQGICVCAEARAEAEDGNSGLCSAPVWLRWRTQQELGGGERFDDAHGSAADRTAPE